MGENICFDFKEMVIEGGQGMLFQDPIDQALDPKELTDMATHFGEPSGEGLPTDTQALSSLPCKRVLQKSLNGEVRQSWISLRIDSPLGQDWLMELQGHVVHSTQGWLPSFHSNSTSIDFANSIPISPHALVKPTSPTVKEMAWCASPLPQRP